MCVCEKEGRFLFKKKNSAIAKYTSILALVKN